MAFFTIVLLHCHDVHSNHILSTLLAAVGDANDILSVGSVDEVTLLRVIYLEPERLLTYAFTGGLGILGANLSVSVPIVEATVA